MSALKLFIDIKKQITLLKEQMNQMTINLDHGETNMARSLTPALQISGQIIKDKIDALEIEIAAMQEECDFMSTSTRALLDLKKNVTKLVPELGASITYTARIDPNKHYEDVMKFRGVSLVTTSDE